MNKFNAKNLSYGDVIDNTFEIEELLGEGAAGKVYKARIIRDWNTLHKNSLVAVKVYKSEIFEKEGENSVLKRRIREAKSQNKVLHKNVIKVFDTEEFWDSDYPSYLVMEYVQGQSLDEIVRHANRLSISQIYRYSYQIVQGVSSLHSVGILHRDIKPSNIIVDSNGQVKILDLGVIRPLDESTMTGSQVFLGTLRYSAPEWLFKEECTFKSDIYSVGAVIYSLITKRELFQNTSLYSRLVLAVKEEEPEIKIESLNPKTAYLSELVQKMLSKDPKERPELSEILEFFKLQEGSKLWKSFRERRLKLLLGSSEDVSAEWKQIVNLVESHESETAIANMEFLHLFTIPEIVKYFIPLGVNVSQIIKGYKLLPNSMKVNWVESVYEGLKFSFDGTVIETLYEISYYIWDNESDKKIIDKINPYLEFSRFEWETMIDDVMRENDE